mmetsp:Transcript_94477/g.303862  ORF Transcript_94477/g.303862 Transcript_94477/m.303862 type:complete len:266 (-) Transcript_94477:253-1050(-)
MLGLTRWCSRIPTVCVRKQPHSVLSCGLVCTRGRRLQHGHRRRGLAGALGHPAQRQRLLAPHGRRPRGRGHVLGEAPLVGRLAGCQSARAEGVKCRPARVLRGAHARQLGRHPGVFREGLRPRRRPLLHRRQGRRGRPRGHRAVPGRCAGGAEGEPRRCGFEQQDSGGQCDYRRRADVAVWTDIPRCAHRRHRGLRPLRPAGRGAHLAGRALPALRGAPGLIEQPLGGHLAARLGTEAGFQGPRLLLGREPRQPQPAHRLLGGGG